MASATIVGSFWIVNKDERDAARYRAVHKRYSQAQAQEHKNYRRQ